MTENNFSVFKKNNGKFQKSSGWSDFNFWTQESVLSNTEEEARKIINGTAFRESKILQYLNFNAKSANEIWSARNPRSYVMFAGYPVSEMMEKELHQVIKDLYNQKYKTITRPTRNRSLVKLLGTPENVIEKAAKDNQELLWFETYEKNIGDAPVSYENAKWLINQQDVMSKAVMLHQKFGLEMDEIVNRIKKENMKTFQGNAQIAESLVSMYELFEQIPALQNFQGNSANEVCCYGDAIMQSCSRLAIPEQIGSALFVDNNQNGYKIFWADNNIFKEVVGRNINDEFIKRLILFTSPKYARDINNMHAILHNYEDRSAVFLYLIEDTKEAVVGAIAVKKSRNAVSHAEIFAYSEETMPKALSEAVNSWLEAIEE